MLRISIFLITAIFCLGIADITKVITDSDFEKMIVGDWWGEEFFEGGKRRLLGEISYFPNKKSKGVLILQKVEKSNYKEIKRNEYQCLWRVENGILITYDFIEDGHKTERPPIKDKIVDITVEKAVYKNISDSYQFERYRK